jgi:hypothetical protein
VRVVRDVPFAGEIFPGKQQLPPQPDLPGFYPAVYPWNATSRGLPLSDQSPNPQAGRNPRRTFSSSVANRVPNLTQLQASHTIRLGNCKLTRALRRQLGCAVGSIYRVTAPPRSNRRSQRPNCARRRISDGPTVRAFCRSGGGTVSSNAAGFASTSAGKPTVCHNARFIRHDNREPRAPGKQHHPADSIG